MDETAILNGFGPAERLRIAEDGGCDYLSLQLAVRDPEVVAVLQSYDEGEDRHEFAVGALKIGVLALRQARGQVDGNVIQRECERMLTFLDGQLKSHGSQVNERLTTILRDYFDPETGRFHDRVQRLVKQDGELEQLLRRQIGREDSELCKTLALHFGQQSPLMRVLSPTESDGLMAAMRDTLSQQLASQREAVLKEFSLDVETSALSRMVGQLTESQGDLCLKLQKQISVVVREFSLDEENTALSRLVKRVSQAQETITKEFSLDDEASALSRLKGLLEATNNSVNSQLTLDDETSALARLRREVLGILEAHGKTAQEFQESVKTALAALTAKRGEAAQSTRHGLDFEQNVIDYVMREAQRGGDVAEPTQNNTGRIRNCKTGDCVVRLGPESSAPGGQIVIEAKESKGYPLPDALREIDKARENRDAQVGLFVFSKRTAPEHLKPVTRYGGDVVVVWDADDPQSDVYFDVALTLAKCLCVRRTTEKVAQAADLNSIDTAILEILRTAESLEEVEVCAGTIKVSCEKILNRVRIARERLHSKATELQDRVADLKHALDGAVDSP